MIIPDNIQKIIKNLKTQDNRITDTPIFMVQSCYRIWSEDPNFSDKSCLYDQDGDCEAEISEEEFAKLSWGQQQSMGICEMYYIDIWENKTACLTEEGAKAYIAANGHNLDSPRIYVESGYRNQEIIDLRNWLMRLNFE